ncbi:MAG TPA: sigma-70 family RNA polymerase sigma factor [Acidimicrobiales bacterium]|nr:sigma-70 family RNA polymerase sigma factor [Acidimicrobiales bacterium]
MALPARHHEPDDRELVDALLSGDEETFARVVDAWSPSMLRLARYYVGSDSAAEDVVQEAWLGALRGLSNFEGRSRLRTWVLHIVANIAKTASQRQHRAVPFAADQLPLGPTVAPSRFRGPAEAEAGTWRSPPAAWPLLPEDQLLSNEACQVVRQAVAALPESQRAVIELRDLDGYEPDEVCEALGLTPGNQRVLLHRARASVRASVENYFSESTAAGGQP